MNRRNFLTALLAPVALIAPSVIAAVITFPKGAFFVRAGSCAFTKDDYVEWERVGMYHMKGADWTTRIDELEKCWRAIDALIVPGPLPGNGCDQKAQRNGLILAANTISAMLQKERGTIEQPT